MPIDFMNKRHQFYLNPWARYIEAGIKIIVLDWEKLSENNPTIDFDDFKFDENSLSPEEKEGYQYWSDIFDKN